MIRRNTVLTLTLAIAFVAATAGASECVPADTGGIGDDNCCFTNPNFSGVCTVAPGPDETCSDILAYLNNQASTGKAYCGNTPVRGGWAQVDCEQKSAHSTDTVEKPSATE